MGAVTLNITVLSQHRLFHSSDFRLSTFEGVALDVPAMKMIAVDYPTFNGFVYYTGIARLPGDAKDTGDYIEEWLNATTDMRMFQVVEHLRLSATMYIQGLPPAEDKDRRLTIVVAAFSRERPVAAIISNFEDTEGIIAATNLPELHTFWTTLRQGEGPAILITGNKRAVSREDRALLLAEMLDAGEDARRIRTELQETNRRAARSPHAKQGISEECVVVSTDATSRGSLEMGDQAGLSLRNVRNGENHSLDALLTRFGIAIPGSVRSASFATSKVATPRRPYACKAIMINDSSSDYQMDVILNSNGVNCSVHGLSSAGTVLGSHAMPNDPTRNRYWIWSAGDELDYLAVELSYSASGCGNADGQNAIVIGTQDNPRIARLDTAGRVRDYAEIPAGMSGPDLRAMNEAGAFVGSIETNRDVADSSRQKPAYWDEGGRIRILTDLYEGHSGLAVAINDAGDVLVWAHYDWFGTIAIIWSPTANTTTRLPGSIIPISLTSSGTIIGFDRTDGRDAPALLVRPGDWSRTPVNDGFHPHTANDHLTIAGSVIVDNYENPWIMRHGDRPVLLPSFQFHSASVRFINNEGAATGSLSANEEQHVVIWRPNVP